jgi:hypothetical protein
MLNEQLGYISASAAFPCTKYLKLKIECSSCNISAPIPPISASNICSGWMDAEGWFWMTLGQQIGY